MREIWKAFLARLVHMLAVKPPEPPLTPDYCMCTHQRSSHEDGKHRCHGQFRPDDKDNRWLGCACQVFILDDDDDDDDEPETPTPSELEKLYSR